MSGKIWVYSDPHAYHTNICKFTNYDGTPVRPWDDAIEMTEDLISFYNELVDDGDRVYILGDVAFKPQSVRRFVGRLKGRKVLIPGNHDPKRMSKYIDLFDDIRGYVQRDGWIMSHIPIHPHCMGRWKVNIHGHLHNNQVMKEKMDGERIDERYYNACVERTNFRPKLLDEILHERGLK